MKKAVVTLQRLSAYEQARDMYERREKAMRDIDSRERWARAEGRAEGKAEGRAEGKAEGEKIANAKWQNVVADKDTEIALLKEQIQRTMIQKNN